MTVRTNRLAGVSVVAVALLAAGAAPARSQDEGPKLPDPFLAFMHGIRTVVVSAVPGDPLASGQRLLAAMASVYPSSCPGDPWLLKVLPGTYDLGTSPLVVKPCVELEGAGERATIITRAGSEPGTGTVVVDGDTELRFLTVRNTGGSFWSVAVYSRGTSMPPAPSIRLRHVTLKAEGSGILAATLYIDQMADVVVDSVTATATGGNNTLGFLLGGGRSIVRDSEVTVAGIGYATAIDADISLFAMRDSDVSVSGATIWNVGVRFWETLDLMHVRVTASGIGGRGIEGRVDSSRPATVDGSVIRGSDNSVFVFSPSPYPLRVGASRLEGGPTAGSVLCAGIYDENHAVYANTCPP